MAKTGRPTTGSYTKTKRAGWRVRWLEGGHSHSQAGFPTKQAAVEWFGVNVLPRLSAPGGPAPSPDITLAAFFEDAYMARHGAERAASTRRSYRERMKPALDRFGAWTLRDLEHATGEIAEWRAKLPSEGYRYRSVRQFREVMARAVDWRYVKSNPVKPAKAPRATKIDPLSRADIERILTELAPGPEDSERSRKLALVNCAAVMFAAETGLRTHEWLALERRDIDWNERVVYVSRRYSKGKLTEYLKTDKSGVARRVPLTAGAMRALSILPPRLDTRLLFPGERGGYFDLHNWRRRVWYTALDSAGISRRGPYALRHTFATEALAAGIPVRDVADVMGTSIPMIDATYGHRAAGADDSIRARLEARAEMAVAQ